MKIVFNEIIPLNYFIDFLTNISFYDNGSWTINLASYNKSLYNGHLNLFLNACKNFFYLDNENFTYDDFLKIIKKICKQHNYKMVNKTILFKNNKEKILYIYENKS